MASNTTAVPSETKHSLLSLLLGIGVTTLGAAVLALSMIVQRYALSYPEKRVPSMRRCGSIPCPAHAHRVATACARPPAHAHAHAHLLQPHVYNIRPLPHSTTTTTHAHTVFGTTLPRLGAWCVGLLLYGIANGLKVIGFNLGPLTILASVFTTLLGFNLLFARWLLKEEVTWPKIWGTLLIFIGAVTCTGGTPRGVQTEFSPADVDVLLRNDPPGGMFYIGTLGGLVCAHTHTCDFCHYSTHTASPCTHLCR